MNDNPETNFADPAGKPGYQICHRCIMDTSDPEIIFDDEGVCSHCHRFDTVLKPHWHPNEEGASRLAKIIEAIKAEGEGKEYDCILGLSGGVDSSYLALKAKEWGLRPLVVHVDGGWNSELAAKNIETIVKKLDFDLFTYVVDWEEMRDLQLAFVRAAVANQDVPQDHAYFAKLYEFATKNNIKYVLNGSNIATESVLPAAWGYFAMDARHLKGIHRKFGSVKLKTFPLVSFFQYYFYYPFVKKMQIVRALNLIPFDKEQAIKDLEEGLGWRYYGGKHHESRFTKFFQAHYLPTKFGYDKRRPHLSSLILSGQLSRDDALKEMDRPLYDDSDLREDQAFVRKKLGLSAEEFAELLAAPNKTFRDYPSNWRLYRLKEWVIVGLGLRKR